MEEQYNDIRKLVKEAGTEKPPVDFLQNVMNEVVSVSKDTSTLYQPLISKKAWLVIGFLVLALLIILSFFSEDVSILDKIDVTLFSINHIKNPFSGFKFHSTTMYGIIFLSVLLMLQITVIKRRIDKTYTS